MLNLIDNGDWGHSTYQVFLDLNGNYTKLKEVVTGASAVCITKDNKVVLINNEPLGGHTERSETPIDTIKRESLEEGGFEIEKTKYFGFYKITQSDRTGELYKNKYPKVGLILFFIAVGKIISDPTDKTAGELRIVPISGIPNDISINHKMLLEGIKLYPEYVK